MRISDWSSDVCSSDLFQLLGLVLVLGVAGFFQFGVDLFEAGFQRGDAAGLAGGRLAAMARGVLERLPVLVGQMWPGLHPCPALRSEARRVGKGCVRTWSSRGSPHPYKKKTTN